MEKSGESQSGISENCLNYSVENLIKRDTKKSRNYDYNFLFENYLNYGYKSQESRSERESPSESLGLVIDTEVDDANFAEVVNQRNKEISHKNNTQPSWVTCTRFKPPKLPRSKKRVSSLEKKLGRGPRIPFSPHQIAILENTFSKSQYLSTADIIRIANALHLTETRIKIWFQNRRARYRKEGHSDKQHSAQVSSSTDMEFYYEGNYSRHREFHHQQDIIYNNPHRRISNCQFSNSNSILSYSSGFPTDQVTLSKKEFAVRNASHSY